MEDEDDKDSLTVVMRGAAITQTAVQVGHYLSFEQDGRTQRVRIGPSGVLVGRLPACDVAFPVPEVSRRHCRILPQGETVVVEDLGSTNGTFIGGRRIERPERLGNGGHIAVGGHVLRYEQRDEREAEAEARLSAEVRQAVAYVRASLPEPINDGPVRAEWWYEPSSEVGGDAFGYQFLDATTFAGFLIDVTGHGIGAGMHAVVVANVVRRRALPGVDFRDPGAVVAGLNQMFPMETHDGLIFTLFYFAYDVATRVLRFCTAGHHPGFLAARPGADPEPVWVRAPAVGMLPSRSWPQGQVTIASNSRFYVFSDGAFEIEAADGKAWSIADLRQLIGRHEHAHPNG